MSDILGVSPGVFLGLTVGLFGFIALLTGQAIADSWRGAGHAIAAAIGLALANRFLAFALFGGPLLSVSGFLVAWGLLTAVSLFAWRATLVRKMVRQYPWLYEPDGLLGWRQREAGAPLDVPPPTPMS